LSENLASFFNLDYPRYELIFSVAEFSDPACDVILQLMTKYPRIDSKLLVGEVKAGPNPKVNNLIRPYKMARHDWVLISDSNVRVPRNYLREVVRGFTPDVGIVTAVIAGRQPRSGGAWLEAVFLNTFYARWMVIAGRIGAPVVVGKSMLFRRSDVDRFGGIANLKHYLAEDYMAGKAMRFLGRRVLVMRHPVSQPLGEYTLSAFWSRHLRWGRIRKAQAPLAFLLKPMFSGVVSGLIGALALRALCGFDFFAAFGAHLLLWSLADLIVMRALGEAVTPKTLIAWLARETLHMPMWFHILLGHTVCWRGQTLTVARGGILKA
jgi:ceramide glucosyltransferase